MICLNCGKQIADGSKFCFYCGAKTGIKPAPESSGNGGLRNKIIVAALVLAVMSAGGFWWWENSGLNGKQNADSKEAATIHEAVTVVDNTNTAKNQAEINTTSDNDVKRKSDMRQLVSAQEMYYGDNGHYLKSAAYPDAIGDYLSTPVDPTTHEKYGAVSNAGNNEKFCYYAKLSNGTYYAATQSGNMELPGEPKTLAQCANEPEPGSLPASSETIMSGEIIGNNAGAGQEDKDIAIIKQYYELLSRGDLAGAYAMHAPDKRPSWNDYQGWYQTAISAVPIGFKKADDGNWRFEVQYEDRSSGSARYLVVMAVSNGLIVPVSSVKTSES